MKPVHPGHRVPRARQSGVVLLFSLIALAIMLIAAVALVRSFQSSLFTSGNIAFKRDLQNQSERAVAKVLPLFSGAGPLAIASARASSDRTRNYSAVMLATNAQGIPLALLAQDTAAAFTAVAVTVNDITPSSDSSLPANQIKSIRYIVDRLCSSAVDETIGSAQCRLGDNPVPAGTSLSNLQGADRPGVSASSPSVLLQSVIYRISIRVIGPRDTQSFFQSTFTVPS